MQQDTDAQYKLHNFLSACGVESTEEFRAEVTKRYLIAEGAANDTFEVSYVVHVERTM